MAMKVIGTGAPRMLTVRVGSCQFGVLRDELHDHRARITRAATRAHANSSAPGPGPGDRDVERCHDELLPVSRLLDDLRTPASTGQPLEIVGPTWLLGPVVRGGAVLAAERFMDTLTAFGADTGSPTPDELRAALETARGCTATLIGLDHAENHAVDT